MGERVGDGLGAMEHTVVGLDQASQVVLSKLIIHMLKKAFTQLNLLQKMNLDLKVIGCRNKKQKENEF